MVEGWAGEQGAVGWAPGSWDAALREASAAVRKRVQGEVVRFAVSEAH